MYSACSPLYQKTAFWVQQRENEGVLEFTQENKDHAQIRKKILEFIYKGDSPSLQRIEKVVKLPTVCQVFYNDFKDLKED